MKKHLIAVSTSALLALTATAQDKSTLDLLVKKGLITQQEAEGLMKAKASAPTPVTAKTSVMQNLTLGAIVHARYSLIDLNEKKGAADPAAANGFMARRIAIPIGAKSGDFSALIMPEFDTTRNGAAQACLNIAFLQYATEYGNLSAGLRKVNFGLEEYLSPPAIDNPVVEYSTATMALVSPFASRHLGVYWDGKVKNTGLFYGVALTNSQTDLWNTGGAAPGTAVNPATNNNELSYWANAGYEFSPADDTKVTVGLNAGWVGDTGTSASSVFGYNPFVNVTSGKFGFMGEFIGWLANGDKGAADNNSWGYNLTATYKVTDSLEPVLRFSRYEGDGRRINSQTAVFGAPAASSTYDEVSSVYVGFNWYITPKSLKLQTGYEFSQLTDAANKSSQVDASAFRTQIQAVF